MLADTFNTLNCVESVDKENAVKLNAYECRYERLLSLINWPVN